MQMRRSLQLPPFSLIVEATGDIHRLDGIQMPLGCALAKVSTDRALLRFTDSDIMQSVLTEVKASLGRHVRLAVEPYRQ
jgi:hypothetical protein